MSELTKMEGIAGLSEGERPHAVRQTRIVVALEEGDIKVLLLGATYAAERVRKDHAEQIVRALDWLRKQAREACGRDLMSKEGRWPADREADFMESPMVLAGCRCDREARATKAAERESTGPDPMDRIADHLEQVAGALKRIANSLDSLDGQIAGRG